MIESVLFSKLLPLSCKVPLERQIFFLADEIRDFELILDRDGIAGVKVELDEWAKRSAAEIGASVRAAERAFVNPRPALKARRIWTRPSVGAYPEGTFSAMRERGIAFAMGPGLVGVGELMLRLMDAADRRAREIVKAFGAVEYRYPTLILRDTMRQGGYFRSFPHFLMFVTRLHSDFETYRNTMMAADAANSYLDQCCTTDLCLPPTMCYHTYAQLAGTSVDANGRVITARGKSFRFESRYEKNLERLWDFTIREVVFLGAQRAVNAWRERLMQEVFRWMEEWNLSGFCETANDPFFTEDDEKNSTFLQRMMTLKYELHLDIGGAETLAAASFNLHNDFFGKAFEIRDTAGGPVRTGCAGFGLERLAFAVFSQHGLDPQGWPESIRSDMEKFT